MLEVIIQSLGTILLFFLILCNISQYSFGKLHLCIVIAFTTAISTILYLSNPRYEEFIILLITSFAALFLFYKTKKVIISIGFSVLSMMIILISSSITGAITIILFRDSSHYNRENIFLYSFSFFVVFIISHVVSKYIGKLFHIKKISLATHLKNKNTILMLLALIISCLFFYVNFFIVPRIENPNIYQILTVSTNIFHLAVLIAAVYYYFVSVRDALNNAHDKELLNILRGYTADLESINEEMQKFRHDYINLVTPIYGFIQDKDLDALNDYLLKNVAPVSVKFTSKNIMLDKLRTIQLPEIRGLLSIKLMQAQEYGIPVHIEVVGVIDHINFDIVDLTKIIGIYLDNAVEECRKTDNPYIKFAIFKKTNKVVMYFVNPLKPPAPLLSEIYKKNFSTKGKNRGLGLYTVKQIMDKSKTAVKNTTIVDNEFIQELIFLNSGTGRD